MAEFIGHPVRSLQTMLRGTSYLDANMPSVIPDGIFGRDTLASLTAFQRNNSLPVTGEADLETWNALRDKYRSFLNEYYPEPLTPYFSFAQKIMPGEQNNHMFMIQSLFIAIAKIYDNVPDVTLTGINDDESVAAVKWFQRISGLASTGIINMDFWRILVKTYRLSPGNGTVE